MPTAAAVNGLQLLNKYNKLVQALKNFNSVGTQLQEIAAALQADPNYTVFLTAGERTALTNFLNSINSIIPISNIPELIS